MRFSLSLAFLAASSAVWAQVPHNYDLIDVNWTLSFDEKNSTIAGDVTNTLAPTEDGVKDIALNEGKLNLEKVTVDGQAATYRVDGEQLVITLPEATPKGKEVHVRVVYTGKPQAGVYFSAPDRSTRKTTTEMVFTQGEAEDTRYWLPTYDEPNDKATSEAHIIVPKGYTAISNGRLVDVQHEGDHDVFHWKMDHPHSTYLISFVAGNYHELHEQWGDIPVNSYVPAGTEAMDEPSFGGTADMVRFYSELTGVKYPYPKFAQEAVADFPFGGMENISAVTQTIDALFPPSEDGISDSRGLVLHELAHQWFGDLVTCEDWPNIWLNEGFATFLPHFYFRYKDGEDTYQIGKLGDIEVAIGANYNQKRPVVETKYSVPMDLFFTGHVYNGASARMFTLMSILGEKDFWRGVKAYLTERGFKNATTEQFFDIMGRTVGKDLSWFDKEWFHTAAIPEITVKRDGQNVTLTQSEPYFTLDLDVWSLHEGHWNRQKVALHGQTASLEVDSGNDPVVVDPQVNWVANIKYPQPFSEEDIREIYAHAPNAAEKVRMLESASGQGFTALLDSWMKSETSAAMREQIASRIPADQTDLLLSLTRDADRRIAITAVRTLGRGKNTDAAVSRLREMYQSETSDDMKAAEVRSLLDLTKDDDLAAKAWNTDTYNDGVRSAALAYYAGAKPDYAREIALKALTDGHSETIRAQAVGLLGRLKDKPGEKTVFQALIAELSDKGHRDKEAAIGAVSEYGDPAAIPYLEKLADYSMYQIRQPAVAVIAQLKKAAGG